MCTDSGSHIRSLLPNCILPLAPFHQSRIYMACKKHFRKADQSTLASGGSEHAWLFSVTISWGNKMNFSLCVNIPGFCLDSHIWLQTSLLWQNVQSTNELVSIVLTFICFLWLLKAWWQLKVSCIAMNWYKIYNNECTCIS